MGVYGRLHLAKDFNDLVEIPGDDLGGHRGFAVKMPIDRAMGQTGLGRDVLNPDRRDPALPNSG